MSAEDNRATMRFPMRSLPESADIMSSFPGGGIR